MEQDKRCRRARQGDGGDRRGRAGPKPLAELSSATGLPRATVHRLAVALEAHGMVRRDDEGRFVLGLRLVALGRAAGDAFPLAALALPALCATARPDRRERAALRPRGRRRICVASLQSPHGLRTIVNEGAVLPLDRAPAGVCSGRCADGANRRRRGWAESMGEREAGVASVSAPVIDRGRVVAAVSVSGPIERLTRTPGNATRRPSWPPPAPSNATI